MQCPPTPGPGLNLVKPNGFVAAAFNMSWTFKFKFSQSNLNSFTSAILTDRYVFSKSLEVSAISTVSTK